MVWLVGMGMSILTGSETSLYYFNSLCWVIDEVTNMMNYMHVISMTLYVLVSHSLYLYAISCQSLHRIRKMTQFKTIIVSFLYQNKQQTLICGLRAQKPCFHDLVLCVQCPPFFSAQHSGLGIRNARNVPTERSNRMLRPNAWQTNKNVIAQ